jgi:exosortase/archaeosortase family protein
MKKDYYSIIIRYLILIFISIPNLYIFYLIFTPLTIYPVYFILNLFFEVFIQENTLSINGFSIEIIKACVAGSAYYLLLILNLSIPKINLKKRLNMILFAFSSLLILNILRIFLLTSLLLIYPSLFNITHKLFWYLISIIFVIAIWFTEVKIFKIKQIPIYSDIKLLIKQINKPKSSKKHK